MPGPGGGGPRGQHYMTEEEKAQRPKVTKALLIRIFSYLKPYWKQFLLVLVCIFVSSVFSLYPSILTGRIIDEGLIGRDLNKLIMLIGLSLAVTLGANLIGVLESYLNTWIAQHIIYDMRNAMYLHLQKMSQSFFTSNNQGDIITRMTSDIDGVRSIIANTLTSILSNSVTLIVAMVAMFQKNWILALLGIVIVPLFTIPTRNAGKTRWSLTREAQECSDEINGILNETLSVSGQLLVKLFGREDAEYERYETVNRKMIGLNIRESMAGRWFRVVISTVSSIGPMLLYLVGGILMMKYDSDLTVGDITVLVALLGRMYMPVNQLLNIQVDWIRSMANFTRIFEYYDMPVEISDRENALVPVRADGDIEFKHVDFWYEEGKQILKNINFRLESGHSIAIVGPSGSGNSTMSQETYLFNGTIRDNLLYAKPDATEAELLSACARANILEFIEKQEKGLDTLVGNRGLKLSGGEKQRISIARVLLKDPTVLIFDEATSALDSISEKKIQEAIDPLVEERTSILIAHRLSTILAADEILVVKDGEIVERGTHEELVGAGGVYTELYETQFKKGLSKNAEK